MKHATLSLKAKFSLVIAITLWASAFVAIRAGLRGYSPGSLALLRYLIASTCMLPLYLQVPNRQKFNAPEVLKLLIIGMIGIGFYNVTLNYAELTVSSGMASFIISQCPLLTVILAVIFLKERLNKIKLFGFGLSIIGVAFITLSEKGALGWDQSLIYIFLATFAGGLYNFLQKSILSKYHAIEATAYIIWGGTLALLIYLPQLSSEISHASVQPTLMAVYLGIFPAAIGYVAWSYVLAEIPASRAVSFLYFSPFVASLLGWLCLGETMLWTALLGGVIAIIGIKFAASASV